MLHERGFAWFNIRPSTSQQVVPPSCTAKLQHSCRQIHQRHYRATLCDSNIMLSIHIKNGNGTAPELAHEIMVETQMR